MTKYWYPVCLCLFLFAAAVNAQTVPSGQWASYMNSENIQSIAEDAAHLWLGTTAGFVQYTKATGASQVYSKTNSPLPHNNVYSVAVDQQGNKWVGTWAGAAKFDGTGWEVFTMSNSKLPSNVIWGIAVDKNNNVWFATQAGMARLSGGVWTVFTKTSNPELTIDNFHCVAADANGNVWGGTSTSFYQQGGLFKFDGTKWTAYTMQNSTIPDYIINAVAAGKNNEVWIASDSRGLIKFDGASFTVYDQQSSNIADIRIRGVSVDKNNAVWVACEGYLKKGGVSKFNGTTFTNYTADARTYQSVTSLSIFASADGAVYSGAQYKGLSVFGGSQWTLKKVSGSGLPSNFVNCVLIDSKNTKWFGTEEAGLAKFDGTTWTVYDTTTAIKLPHLAVLSIAEDRDGVIWVGTRNGIVKITGGVSVIYNAASVVPVYADWVQGIRVDKNNMKWFACGSGLLKYDGNEWVYFGPSNIPVMPSFLSNFTNVFIDNNSNIWVGVLGFGVLKYDGTTWTAYSPANSGLTFADVEEFAQDNTGTMWMGAFGQSPDGNNGGMFTYSGSAWKNLRENNSPLPGNYINAMTKSPTGEMWIGATHYGASFGGGLAIYDGVSQWTVLTPENSKLPYPYIPDIQFDNGGSAWIATYGSGVAMYNRGVINRAGEETKTAIAKGYALGQNFPNPFNPSTTISFTIPERSMVTMTVYDVMGRTIATLVEGEKNAGNYSVQFGGAGLSSGVYLCRMTALHGASVWSDAKKIVMTK